MYGGVHCVRVAVGDAGGSCMCAQGHRVHGSALAQGNSCAQGCLCFQWVTTSMKFLGGQHALDGRVRTMGSSVGVGVGVGGCAVPGCNGVSEVGWCTEEYRVLLVGGAGAGEGVQVREGTCEEGVGTLDVT